MWQDDRELMDDSAFDFASQPADDVAAGSDGARAGADIDAELSTFASQHGNAGPGSIYSSRYAVCITSQRKPFTQYLGQGTILQHHVGHECPSSFEAQT